MAERQPDGSFYYFNGNENGILLIDYLQKVQPHKPNPYVVASFVTINFIDRMLANSKVKIHRTGTGFKLIADIVEHEQAHNQNLLIAFEESIGALLFPFNREKDGYQIIALSLETIDYYQKHHFSLKMVLDGLYEQFGHWFGRTDSFVIKHQNWKDLMQAKLKDLQAYSLLKIGHQKISKIAWNDVNDCLDWLLENDNWIRFRLSGTEPKFKIYFNLFGSSQQAIISEINHLRDELIKYLDLTIYL